ncbi:hypothetical protein FRC12_013216 [Ceratobasidium sp. 428]|nr:hypothetical protein FRC12_013216 [Ceratobasidium sp. 428]
MLDDIVASEVGRSRPLYPKGVTPAHAALTPAPASTRIPSRSTPSTLPLPLSSTPTTTLPLPPPPRPPSSIPAPPALTAKPPTPLTPALPLRSPLRPPLPTRPPCARLRYPPLA